MLHVARSNTLYNALSSDYHLMWYQNIRGGLFGFVIKHACDRKTDGQNYDGRAVNKRLANVKRSCDCSVLCLSPNSSLCSCPHSILDTMSFGGAVVACMLMQ